MLMLARPPLHSLFRSGETTVLLFHKVLGSNLDLELFLNIHFLGALVLIFEILHAGRQRSVPVAELGAPLCKWSLGRCAFRGTSLRRAGQLQRAPVPHAQTARKLGIFMRKFSLRNHFFQLRRSRRRINVSFSETYEFEGIAKNLQFSLTIFSLFMDNGA